MSNLDLSDSILNNVQEFEKAAVSYVKEYMNKVNDLTLKSSIRVLLEMARSKDVEDRWYYPIIKENIENHARRVMGISADPTGNEELTQEQIEALDELDVIVEEIDE